MIQVINVMLLSISALLTVIRKQKMVSFVQCMVIPFDAIHTTLHDVHESFIEDYLTWGSEVWLLEKMLNEKFNPGATVYFITIGEGTRPVQPYLYFTSTNRPLFMNPTFYGHLHSELTTNGFDFVVNIPSEIGLDADDVRVIQQINRFKLAGKQYQIIIT